VAPWGRRRRRGRRKRKRGKRNGSDRRKSRCRRRWLKKNENRVTVHAYKLLFDSHFQTFVNRPVLITSFCYGIYSPHLCMAVLLSII
jgi:hypothetical protein